MTWLVAFTVGVVVGCGVSVYGLSWLIAATAPEYPPELAERFEDQRDKARWN